MSITNNNNSNIDLSDISELPDIYKNLGNNLILFSKSASNTASIYESLCEQNNDRIIPGLNVIKSVLNTVSVYSQIEKK